MAEPKEAVVVDTAALLAKCQQAMQKAGRDADFALFDAAESVHSALMVVARHPKAELPAALKKHIERIGGRYE